jgi:hypothetical protein
MRAVVSAWPAFRRSSSRQRQKAFLELAYANCSPLVPLPAATGAIYTLDTEGGGDRIAGDPRVLNFRVFGLRWAVPDDSE